MTEGTAPSHIEETKHVIAQKSLLNVQRTKKSSTVVRTIFDYNFKSVVKSKEMTAIRSRWTFLDAPKRKLAFRVFKKSKHWICSMLPENRQKLCFCS